MRLALERELALADADRLGLSREAARRWLSTAAAAARPRRALPSAQAAYVRALAVARPRPTRGTDPPLDVVLPEWLLTRTGGVVRAAVFDADVIDEMVAWELAAALEVRTMAEWALNVLASAQRGV